MVNDEVDDRYRLAKPLTVELTYEDGKVEQYSFPQEVNNNVSIVAGEWVSIPDKLTDEQTEWTFYELGPKMRHLGEE